MKPDAVVVGAGLHGLAVAAYLARGGASVLVLEAARPGGLQRSDELAPGYRAAGLVHGPSTVSARVVEELDLAAGCRLIAGEPPVLAATAEGPGLFLSGSDARDEIARHSAADAARYGEWRAFLDRARPLVERVLGEAPPDVLDADRSTLMQLARDGLLLRRLGRVGMLELLRVLPMCAADWLGEWFESPLLKSVLVAPALRGGVIGPWAPHTAGLLLLSECAGRMHVEGGLGELVAPLERAATEAGAELRSGAVVKRIQVEGQRVQAIELEDGERIEVSRVVATCDPRSALLGLLGARALPPRDAAEIAAYRTRGTTSYVRLALSAPLFYRSRPGQAVEHAVLPTDLDDLERAFDAQKYRRRPERPFLDVRQPTLGPSTLAAAPAGHALVSIEVHGAPFHLESGWSDAEREALGDSVVAQLAEVSDLDPASIVARQVLTPADLARELRLDGGHVHHGETTLDQLLFLRPSAGCARYATPIEGLFLAGRGTHPGPFLPLACAPLVAELVLERD